jgi:hypothetical protein
MVIITTIIIIISVVFYGCIALGVTDRTQGLDWKWLGTQALFFFCHKIPTSFSIPTSS